MRCGLSMSVLGLVRGRCFGFLVGISGFSVQWLNYIGDGKDERFVQDDTCLS